MRAAFLGSLPSAHVSTTDPPNYNNIPAGSLQVKPTGCAVTSLPSAAAAQTAPVLCWSQYRGQMHAVHQRPWLAPSKQGSFFDPCATRRAMPGCLIALQRKARAWQGCSCLVYFCHPLNVSSCADLKEAFMKVGFSLKSSVRKSKPSAPSCPSGQAGRLSGTVLVSEAQKWT